MLRNLRYFCRIIAGKLSNQDDKRKVNSPLDFIKHFAEVNETVSHNLFFNSLGYCAL
jgi:hypothetical protein